jgi:hypothetical protein
MEVDDMLEMTKEYVMQTLREEHLWKVGESDTFEVMLSQKWEFTLRKEEEIYAPYKYALNGKKLGTHETWSRRYRSMDTAFLHIVNRLNENANIKDRYKSIEEWLLESK